MNKSNSSALSLSLLNSLNSFRGHFSINELEDIVVSLVFLRFMKEESLKNDFFKFDNSIEIFGKSSNQNYNDKFIGETLTKTFHVIELDNPMLNGVFSSFDFSCDSKNINYIKVIETLIRLISNLDFESTHFGQFFDDLHEIIRNSKVKGFDFTQPKELTQLMLSFMPKKESLSIYNPFSGSASLSLNLPKDSFYLGQEINRKVWAFSKLRLLAYKVKNQNVIENIDVFKSWSYTDIRFDFIVTNPPFNLKLSQFDNEFDVDDRFYNKSNANSFIVSQCYKRLIAETGKAVMVLPSGFLASQNTREKALREYLINQGAVELIISLPSGILNYTSIPFNLLVLSNSRKKTSPVLVDASECFIKTSKNNRILDLEKIYNILNVDNSLKRTVHINEIAANDYNLMPTRYLFDDISFELEPRFELVTLNDLITVFPRITPVPDAKGKFIKTRDLSDDVLNYVKSFDNLEEISIPSQGTGFASSLVENSLLLSLKWKTLKPTFFISSYSEIYYPTIEILACNIKSQIIDLDYLIFELDKEYVIKQIEALKKGTAVPYLSKASLLTIVIKVPKLREQQKTDVKLVKDTIVKAKLKELGLEEQFTQLKKEQIEDLSLKKHNIMQHLNNVQSSIDSLSFFMNTNNGILDAKSIIHPKLGTTVQKRFELLAESLKEAIYFVDNITNEINFQEAQYLNVFEIINSCIEKGIQNDQLFEISPFIDEDSFINEEETFVPMIKFSKADFEELYNNILQNAIVHGFTDPSRKYKFAIELKYDQELGKIVVSFLNDGKPFPKGMADRYQIKGEKAGVTGNKGIGSWKVYEIAKHFGASLNVLDLPDDKFPVKIELVLNLENE
jgi:type I restriction-modification system DNA methylase subunit